jgi:protein-S-isoprenylcysteine O-methyltransferase Ste14
MSFAVINPWFAKAIILVSTLAVIIIPAYLHRRGGATKVVRNRKGRMEGALLAVTSLGFFLPLVWIATPILQFADYPLHPVPVIAGIFCLASGLWFLFRSHADLGTSWSITLEIREKHQLVTQGIYRHVRHPMYLALLLYSSGQALVLPNWFAGPSYLVAFALLFALRVGPEERMMVEEFGKNYEAYMARTKRLIPGVW